MYEVVSEKLKASLGSLVIHTAPNKWNYLYQHPREQKDAINAGFWSPRIRRTWYENLMHINEQNPRVLKRQLSRFFPHVHLWFPDDQSMGGGLIRPNTIQDCRLAKSIFAIASHRPIDINNIIPAFYSHPLSDEESGVIDFFVVDAPETADADSCFDVTVKVKNRSNKRIATLPPNPYHLSYHWMDESGKSVVWDGLRTPFAPPLLPGGEIQYKVKVQAPAQSGIYRLEMAAVQESVRWHDPMKHVAGTLYVRIAERRSSRGGT
jgi:hypothetical protein